ncbi:MAG: hypothetical protein JWN46_1735 [Acidimicrobiales bacterium]|nr:hypothetical protein [Acidimicrobiales bacterium]
MRSVLARVSSVIALSALVLGLAGGPRVDAAASARRPVPATGTAALAPTAIPLNAGWYALPLTTSNTVTAVILSGVVHLAGAMATKGSNPAAFTLPVAFRPKANVFVPVDLCDRNNGRLYIQANGVVSVQGENQNFALAQCFTSLEGASFALNGTLLTVQPGWTNAPFGTSKAAALSSWGVVHLKGAIATTAKNPVAFVLPLSLRPKTAVYVPVDLCNVNVGRLYIQPNGIVTVQAQGGVFANVQCFTSLDGASYVLRAATPLTLQNGWVGAPFATSQPAAANVWGIVHLKGAISSGSVGDPFNLPASVRPGREIYVAVDMCNGTNGRLDILTNGEVFVMSETSYTLATCFTSLDGVSFVR